MRTLRGDEMYDLKLRVKRHIQRFQNSAQRIIYLKQDFDWELAAATVRNFYKELRDFLKLTEDRYVVNTWGENPVAFFDIAIEYYNLWMRYRINLIGNLSPLEVDLDKAFEMISADWQWLNYEEDK
jgi:hypothetical protein